MKKDNYVFGYQTAMEAVAKRTCKTCKYLNEESGLQPDGIGWQTLECELWDGNFDISPVFDDGFSCNKWEKIKD